MGAKQDSYSAPSLGLGSLPWVLRALCGPSQSRLGEQVSSHPLLGREMLDVHAVISVSACFTPDWDTVSE